MMSIMTKAELLKMLEPLSDTDVIQCQVNYTTNRTEAAYSQYKNTTEVKPLTTEVQKIDWLNKEINDLKRLVEIGCTDPENVEYSIQMFQELLSTKMATCRANAVRKIKDNLSRDVAEFFERFKISYI